MCYISDLVFEASSIGITDVDDIIERMNDKSEIKIIAQEADDDLIRDLIVDDGGHALSAFMKALFTNKSQDIEKNKENLVNVVLNSARNTNFAARRIRKYMEYYYE